MVITDVLALLQGTSAVQGVTGQATGQNKAADGLMGLFAQILAQTQTAQSEAGSSAQTEQGKAAHPLAALFAALQQANPNASPEAMLPGSTTEAQLDQLVALLEQAGEDQTGSQENPLVQALAALLAQHEAGKSPLVPSTNGAEQTATANGETVTAVDGEANEFVNAFAKPVERPTRGEAVFRPFLVRGLEPVSVHHPHAPHAAVPAPTPAAPHAPPTASPLMEALLAGRPQAQSSAQVLTAQVTGEKAASTAPTEPATALNNANAPTEEGNALLSEVAKSSSDVKRAIAELLGLDGSQTEEGPDHPRILAAPKSHVEVVVRGVNDAQSSAQLNGPPSSVTGLNGAELGARPLESQPASVTSTPASASGPPEHGGVNRPTLATVGEHALKSVRLMAASGEQSMKMRLIPEHLGEVHLTVRSVGETVHVHVAAANASVRDALEAQLQGLRDNLARDGFEVGKVTVSSDSGQAGNQNALFGGRGQTPFNAHERSGPPGYPWRSNEPATESPPARQFAPSQTVYTGALNLIA